MAEVVIDASALVDLLLRNDLGAAVHHRIAGHVLHAPAHIDAEVLSALGRLNRDGDLTEDRVELMVRDLAKAPVQRHSLAELLSGTWSRRHQLRLVDAFYVELTAGLGVALVTTDRRLRALPDVDVVTA